MPSILGPSRSDLLIDECLHDIFLSTATLHPSKVAIHWQHEKITYRDLHKQALQIAVSLRQLRQIGPGSIVGIWLSRSPRLHAIIIAVSMLGGTYVPFDADTPMERVTEVIADLNAVLLVDSRASFIHPLALDIEALYESTVAIDDADLPTSVDHQSIAYIICTSGSTGKPKSIAVTHRNICHFIRADNDVLRIGHDDVVYQGSSAAFDMFFEETFLTYLVGATMAIASKSDVLLSDLLHLFFIRHSITILFCVPTLLLLMNNDSRLKLRLLNVGGESFPQALIDRWWNPDRLIYNSYGPTETTVAATLSLVRPGEPISIGVPLPNYVCCLLDEDTGQPTSDNTGELCISGPGVSLGYLGRDELTKEKFTEFGYRTGDRVTFDSERIFFHQRIDSQVKVRGFRIELDEIEHELRALTDMVQSATVALHNEQIIAYVVGPLNESSMREILGKRLPSYMIPDRLVHVDEKLPLLASGKIDRKSLADLLLRDQQLSEKKVETKIDLEGPVNHSKPIDDNPTDIILNEFQNAFPHIQATDSDDFFRDLGGHSLSAAHAVTKLREFFPDVSVQDLYECKTARVLAERLAERHLKHSTVQTELPASPTAGKPTTLRLVLCSTIQFLVILIVVGVAAFELLMPYFMFHVVLESLGVGYACAVAYALFVSIPMFQALRALVIKWVVIGRYREGDFPLWGAMYVRWWTVEQFCNATVFDQFSGTPVMPVIYRLLGARIGRRVHIDRIDCSATDLLTVGDGSTLSANVDIRTAFVEDYTLKFRRVRIERDVHVGMSSVLQGPTSMEDHSELGHMSFLPSGTCVPTGQAWQGSPAKYSHRTTPVETLADSKWNTCTTLWVSCVFILLVLFFFPFMSFLPMLPGLLLFDYVALTSISRWTQVLIMSPAVGVLYTVLIIIELLVVRLIFIGTLKEGVYSTKSYTYIKKWTFDQLFDMAVANIYTLFASIYAAPLLRALGMKVGERCEVSTTAEMVPSLVEIGDESFVADTASLANSHITRGRMHLRKIVIGKRVFIGNASFIPGGAQIPDECLVGCLSVLHSKLRKNDSCMGSPPFIMSRQTAAKDGPSDRLTYRPSRGLVLGRILIDTLRVFVPRIIVIFEIGIAFEVFVITRERIHFGLFILALPVLYIAVLAIPSLLFSLILKWVLVGKYKAQEYPLWSWFVWMSEFVTVIYEHMVCDFVLEYLQGTLFVAPVLRCFGAHIGRGCYFDSLDITEFDLVHIGDYAVLDSGAALQTHLFEDRVMKLGEVYVENQATIGCSSIVLPNTRIGRGARVGPLSLVLQGEGIPPESSWQGIPIQADTARKH